MEINRRIKNVEKSICDMFNLMIFGWEFHLREVAKKKQRLIWIKFRNLYIVVTLLSALYILR